MTGPACSGRLVEDRRSGPPGGDAEEAVREDIAMRVSAAVQSDPELLDLFQPVEGIPGPATLERRRRRLRTLIERIAAEVQASIPGASRSAFVDSLLDDILGFGPIEELLHENDVEDVHVNGFSKVFVKRRGKDPEEARSKRDGRPIRFRNEEHLKNIVLRQLARVNRRVDESSPLVDAQLPESKHRINVIIPPLVSRDIGWSVTLRFRPEEPPTWLQLLLWGTWDLRTAVLLALAVKARLNILVCGGSAAGKTTLLNVLGSFIQREHRVVTIEDTLELNLRPIDAPRDREVQDTAQDRSRELMLEDLPNHITLLTRPANAEGRGAVSMRELVTNALRMSPTRLVIGEVRGVEALDMLQALNTGQDGALGTIHARSADDAVYRLVFLVLMAGLQQLQMEQIRAFLVHNGIDLIVHMERSESGARKIAEVVWLRKRLGAGDKRNLLLRAASGGGILDHVALAEFLAEDDPEDKQIKQKLARAFPNPARLAFLEKLVTASADDELTPDDFRSAILFLSGEEAFEAGPTTVDAERQIVDVANLLEVWRQETLTAGAQQCDSATVDLIERFLDDDATRQVWEKFRGPQPRLQPPVTLEIPRVVAPTTAPEHGEPPTPVVALPVPAPARQPDGAVPRGYYLENAEGQRWTITRQPWYIGRGGGVSTPDTDLSSEWGYAYVHRQHCKISFDPSQNAWLLTQLGERRGTEVAGKGDLDSGESVELEEGDEIWIAGGRVRLWFRRE